MKKIIFFKMLVIVTLLSLFVTACDNAPKDKYAYIESSDLPKSSGEDIFAGKTFSGNDIFNTIKFKYEFDNEGSVIYAEKPFTMDTAPYVKVAKYKYAYTPKNEKQGIHALRIHFKPIGYYIDDVLYSDGYADKLISDMQNNSITVSDEYAEIIKKIYKYQFTSTKFSRCYDYEPENETENLSFHSDIYLRNLCNFLNPGASDISAQIKKHSFLTYLGVSSKKCSFSFLANKGADESLKELDFQIYECSKNKAKVVCTYLDESSASDNNTEKHAEYKVAGYAKVTIDYKVELPKLKNYAEGESLFTKVKVTDVDDNLMEYLKNELADITGTGEGLAVSDILDQEFQISLLSDHAYLAHHLGMLE